MTWFDILCWTVIAWCMGYIVGSLQVLFALHRYAKPEHTFRDFLRELYRPQGKS